MAKTDKFREQHAEILALVKEIQICLDPSKLKIDAAPVRHLLSQLAGKLNVHLAMEDKALYPELLQHKNPSVQAKAKSFIEEMGNIKEVFVAYLGQYGSSLAIQQASEAFVKDTQQLFDVLGKRVHAEDHDLYPMVDALK